MIIKTIYQITTTRQGHEYIKIIWEEKYTIDV